MIKVLTYANDKEMTLSSVVLAYLLIYATGNTDFLRDFECKLRPYLSQYGVKNVEKFCCECVQP